MLKFITFILFLILKLASSQIIEKLGQYNVDAETLTISGISSGGGMAVQYHFVYSSEIIGVGMFTGGPFGTTKVYNVTAPPETNIENLMANTAELVASGQIDDTKNMEGQKAFIYNGFLDLTVPVAFSALVSNIYTRYGVDVTEKFDLPHQHGFPTDYYGSPCYAYGEMTQFIHNCGYRGAYEMFKKLYGPSTVNPFLSVDFTLRNFLHEFDQTEFVPQEVAEHFDSIGLVFVPENCRDLNRKNKCKIHVAFHGCGSNRGMFGEIFATRTGYLESAQANDIVIIFPQTRNYPENEKGCWDWVGTTQDDHKYLTKDGWQNIAIHGMVERVINGTRGSQSK